MWLPRQLRVDLGIAKDSLGFGEHYRFTEEVEGHLPHCGKLDLSVSPFKQLVFFNSYLLAAE